LFFRTRLSRLSQHGFAMFSKTTTEVLDEGWKNSFNATFNEPAQDEDTQQIVLGEYCDEERDLLIDDAQATTDPGVRVPLYQEISQNMHDAYT
jgi:ABC-type transport system substrate-binding protein